MQAALRRQYFGLLATLGIEKEQRREWQQQRFGFESLTELTDPQLRKVLAELRGDISARRGSEDAQGDPEAAKRSRLIRAINTAVRTHGLAADLGYARRYIGKATEKWAEFSILELRRILDHLNGHDIHFMSTAQKREMGKLAEKLGWTKENLRNWLSGTQSPLSAFSVKKYAGDPERIPYSQAHAVLVGLEEVLKWKKAM